MSASSPSTIVRVGGSQPRKHCFTVMSIAIPSEGLILILLFLIEYIKNISQESVDIHSRFIVHSFHSQEHSSNLKCSEFARVGAHNRYLPYWYVILVCIVAVMRCLRLIRACVVCSSTDQFVADSHLVALQRL